MKKVICTLVLPLALLAFKADAQTVTLDYYFNHETHKNDKGEPERFHYLWEETDNNGYSILGENFKSQGFALHTLESAPTTANLRGTSVYIIVDPDSKKENPNPNYIQPADVKNIADWVKQGGVLVMFANDSANVELPHFNKLANTFGFNFNNDLQNHVIDDNHFEDGGVIIKNNPVFKTAGKIYMKDVCSISTAGNATSVLKNKAGATLVASAKYGKGTAIAIADPWLYNEYTNGRLPAKYGFENDKAAHDLVAWLKSLTAK
jgi:unsaturated rhamnogalacturonyl hydrolase